jgi:hypothetical protein
VFHYSTKNLKKIGGYPSFFNGKFLLRNKQNTPQNSGMYALQYKKRDGYACNAAYEKMPAVCGTTKTRQYE